MKTRKDQEETSNVTEILKPGFHMIAKIANDARIDENCDLRFLRS